MCEKERERSQPNQMKKCQRNVKKPLDISHVNQTKCRGVFCVDVCLDMDLSDDETVGMKRWYFWREATCHVVVVFKAAQRQLSGRTREEGVL